MRLALPILALGAWLLTGAPARAACAGDCSGDGAVGINELITGVSIALGATPVGS